MCTVIIHTNCIFFSLVLQAMKADAQKKNASRASNKSVAGIHAQEDQALTSSLSGIAQLPCPANPPQ